ncbi:acetylserotonin O-methyltransferase-like [Aotus nancymaae]|uniref:acetylserotonin O-methyltransferase-like n=1 Tax=Aotus nancymaae TaxID=37293 RepID=UPI0030FEA204
MHASRSVFKPGDFFRDPLPPADLYVLCQVLHDWPDDKVHKILSRVSQSCKPGAGLLLVETLLDEEKREARGGLMQSLNVLVQTGGQGAEPGRVSALAGATRLLPGAGGALRGHPGCHAGHESGSLKPRQHAHDRDTLPQAAGGRPIPAATGQSHRNEPSWLNKESESLCLAPLWGFHEGRGCI